MEDYIEQKDTANPWSHHVIASSNSFNFANAFAPKIVKIKLVENISYVLLPSFLPFLKIAHLSVFFQCISIFVCLSQCDEPEAYNPSGWTNKFSIAMRIDTIVRNFRYFSCHFVTFITFMYSNGKFPDNFKQ